MEWIAHLDLDAFFARCEELRNPELEGTPLVICVYTRSGTSGAVSTANYEARELGIGSGMPLSEARKRASEDTVFLEVDHDFYSRKSEQVMSVLRGHSREVQRASVDEAYLRLKNPVEKAKKIKAEIERLGLSASIGIAGNRFVAKMASEHDKPDGLTRVEEGEEEEFLSGKDVGEVHGVGSKTESVLKEHGIEKVGDLQEKTSADLVAILGKKQAASLRAKARGEGSKSFETSDQKQLSRIRTMPQNSSSYSYVRGELYTTTGLLWNRVEERNVAFGSVGLVLKDVDLETYTRSRTIKTSNTREKLFQEADALLERFMSRNPVELRRIGVRISGLVDADRQVTLGRFQPG